MPADVPPRVLARPGAFVSGPPDTPSCRACSWLGILLGLAEFFRSRHHHRRHNRPNRREHPQRVVSGASFSRRCQPQRLSRTAALQIWNHRRIPRRHRHRHHHHHRPTNPTRLELPACVFVFLSYFVLDSSILPIAVTSDRERRNSPWRLPGQLPVPRSPTSTAPHRPPFRATNSRPPCAGLPCTCRKSAGRRAPRPKIPCRNLFLRVSRWRFEAREIRTQKRPPRRLVCCVGSTGEGDPHCRRCRYLLLRGHCRWHRRPIAGRCPSALDRPPTRPGT
mmetsp:Transcript_2724/g.7285  ORF Transcript_2724/g.7285 Transcript_2724/m.7285 type:complete len:278 (-) Transcript_2724:58-891(-)